VCGFEVGVRHHLELGVFCRLVMLFISVINPFGQYRYLYAEVEVLDVGECPSADQTMIRTEVGMMTEGSFTLLGPLLVWK
jgi:hypothetical protein